MKRIFLIVCCLISIHFSFGQEYDNFSDGHLTIPSEYLGDSIKLKLHLPFTHKTASEQVKYPLFIILDSQHETVYPQILRSLDLLMNESQIPEMLMVGIPFNIRNRRYLTSNQKKDGETISGIQKTENFITKELIPLMQKQYQSSDYILVVGHSRTGFLVNYLLYSNKEVFDVAIALSGFYDNEPLGLENMKSFFTNPANLPIHSAYYFTAGTSLEEQTYLKECKAMESVLQSSNTGVKWKFIEQSNANHMTNYWLSVPMILIDHFAPYNDILNEWFEKDSNGVTFEKPSQLLKRKLELAGEKLSCKLNPSLTQLFSIASLYAGKEGGLEEAIKIIKYGKAYYPNYEDLDATLSDFYSRLGDKEQAAYWEEQYKKHLQNKEK